MNHGIIASTRTFAFVLIAFVAACQPFGGGLCVHEYEDPLLVIDEVVSTDGTSVPRVSISDLMHNGVALDAHMLATHPTAYGIEVGADGTILCDVDCGFGLGEGEYSFVVGASGYQESEVRIDATYESHSGNCPSTSSGSTRLSLTLVPLATAGLTPPPAAP